MYVAAEHRLLQHYNSDNLKFINYSRSTGGTHQCSGILTANDLHLHIHTLSHRRTKHISANGSKSQCPSGTMSQCGEKKEGGNGGDGIRAELDLPGWDFVEVRHPPEEAAGHKEQRETWKMSYRLSAQTTDVCTAMSSAVGVDWIIQYVAHIWTNTLPFSLWQWNENPIGSSK